MRSNKGFSLVELIVVIAIMAIIAGVAIPVYSNYITKANDSVNKQQMDDVVYAAKLADAEFGTTTTVAENASKTGFTVTVTGTEKDAEGALTGADAVKAATQIKTIVTTGAPATVAATNGVVTLEYTYAK